MYVSNEMLKNNFKDIPVIHSIEELEKYRDQAVENEFDDIKKDLIESIQEIELVLKKTEKLLDSNESDSE